MDDWLKLPGDAGAIFDRTVTLDASRIEPMITYGTNPGMVAPISGRIPERGDEAFDEAHCVIWDSSRARRWPASRSNVVFIGSCTNSRLSDLRAAAALLRGRRIARGVRMLVVPGSQQVKRAAEAEGLHEVFAAAGAEWRESGCSMCIGMNGDTAAAGQYVVSTSNRNFEGRQGQGARTLLASPATAAAAAVTGRHHRSARTDGVKREARWP